LQNQADFQVTLVAKMAKNLKNKIGMKTVFQKTEFLREISYSI
jgi:hypothetical protein